MKNWLVVANASKARVLEETGKAGVYTHRADLVHPGSRLKVAELGGDPSGHVEDARHGLGSSTFEPRSDPREHERDQFAREVATVLNQGVAAGKCAGLVLVASNPFLGHLKAHLGDQANKVLLRTVASDYTSLDERELAERLALE